MVIAPVDLYHVSNQSFADVEQAVGAFAELEKMDPFRLENMDIYSNLLYVKVRHWSLFWLSCKYWCKSQMEQTIL